MTTPKGFAKLIIVITTVSAAVMELVDTSIVNVAINTMAGSLGASVEDIAWVITSYAIANVIIIPMTSFLAELFGRKNYYLGSMILFTVASYMCGASSGLWELVLWRFIQGIGGGALLSTSQSILFDAFEPKDRPMASGFFGMGLVLGPTLGPYIGGVIIDQTEAWHWIFDINVPIGIVATILTVIFIDKKEGEVSKFGKLKVDWFGIILLTVGIGSLQFVLEKGESEDWFQSNLIVIFSLLAVIGLSGFIWWCLTAKNPIVNLKLMGNRNLAATTVFTFVAGFGLYSSVFIYPVMVQRILGFTPTLTGQSLIPGALVGLFMMPVIGRMMSKGVSPIPFLFIGFIMFAAFCFLCSGLNGEANANDFLIALVLRGIGISMAQLPLVNQAARGLSPKDMPTGIALNNMIRQLGGAFGIALANNYVSQRYAQHRNDLMSNINEGNNLFTEKLNGLTQGFIQKGSDSFTAINQAYKAIEFSVDRQSFLLSYLDTFRMLGLFFLVVLPLIFLLQSKSKVSAKELAKAAAESH